MKKYANYNIYMVLGRDQLMNLYNWYESSYFIKNVNIICFDRECDIQTNVGSQPKKMEYIPLKNNCSSSKIRDLIKSDRIDLNNNVLNKEVFNYIMKHRIYKQ